MEGLNDVNGVWKTDKDELHSFLNLFAEKRLDWAYVYFIYKWLLKRLIQSSRVRFACIKI